MQKDTFETDYLIVGSGAVGMAFADTLLHESGATMVIVDRHGAPGGHWCDAYSFVRLHQPSAYYGVNSKPLGQNAKDATGVNAGSYERASAAELLAYYEGVMQTLLASGRVRYFPMSDYVGEEGGVHRFKSLTSGVVREVVARKKWVDTTHLQTQVPSTHAPKYAVAEGLRCVPLNALPRIDVSPSGYVVVGSGKTGIDACLWLLEHDVPPSHITWIMPRDAWYLNRETVQPGEENFLHSYGGFATQLECVVQANDAADVLSRLHQTGQLLRMSDAVEPTMYHGAIMSRSELELLRGIEHVVRMGRVVRIEPNQIVLERGVVATDAARLYVDCSASAVQHRPVLPVFDGSKITTQFVRTVQPTFSAAFIAHVEIHFDDEAEKNKICTVVPLPDVPSDWLRMLSINMGNQYRWGKHKGLRTWMERSRLDGFTALADCVTEEDAPKVAVMERFALAAGLAMERARALGASVPVAARQRQ